MPIKMPQSVNDVFARMGKVIRTRHEYSEIKRKGGPEAKQLEDDVKACLAPALGPIKQAIRRRDISATLDAVGAVWKANSKITDVIDKHTSAKNAANAASEALIDDLFAKGDLPADLVKANAT